MVVILVANHVQEVHIGCSCSHNPVNGCVPFNQIVGEKRVGHTDIAMLIVIVCTISV